MVPPNLFCEDFLPVEKKPPSWSSHCFGSSTGVSSSSSCSGSSLSSPGESESDRDDEYVAELTRQMAHYMLQEDDSTRKNAKALNLDGSRQQTAVLLPGKGDLKMADKIQNLRINGDDNKFKYQNRETASLSPTSILPYPRKNPDGLRSDFQSKQALIDEQIRDIKLNKFNENMIIRKKQEESLWWGSRPIVCHQTELNKQIRQVESKASWANDNNLHDQQRIGSTSPTVLFGKPVGSKSGSSGTGVFLPRGANKLSERHKKIGCSAVIIPAKVVQALKLHFDRVGVPSRSNSAISLLQNRDGIIGDVNYCLQLQQKSQSRTAPAINNHNPEISCLPQEWTY